MRPRLVPKFTVDQFIFLLHAGFSLVKALVYLWLGVSGLPVSYITMAFITLSLYFLSLKVRRPVVTFHVFTAIFSLQTLFFGGSAHPVLSLWFLILPTVFVLLRGWKSGLVWLVAFSVQILFFPLPLLMNRLLPFTTDWMMTLILLMVTLYGATLFQTLVWQEKTRKLRKTQKRWKSKSLLFREILDRLPLGLVYKDKNLVTRWSNRYQRDLEHRGQQPEVSEAPELVQASDKTREFKTQMLLADGSQHPFLVHQWPRFSKHGVVRGQVQVAIDRTEAHTQAREIDALHQARDLILSLLNHDLRSPIAKVIQTLDWFLQSPGAFDPATWEEIFRDTMGASSLLLDTLSNVQNWLMIQKGGMEPRLQEVNLDDLLQKIDVYYKPQLSQKGQSLQILLPPRSLRTLATDGFLLEVILRNLLSNAHKFSPKGTRITIQVQQEFESTYLLLEDQGDGIPVEVLEALETGHPYPWRYGTDREKGSGIGLRLVKSLLRGVGATWSLESLQPHGTRITLRLGC